MKKFVSLALILGLMVGFTGCTSNAPTDTASTEIKMGRADYAAHGTKSFTNTVVAMDGDTIVGVSIEEYQFMSKETSTGVPNSDADFGTNYANPDMVLGSKITNNETYSANMATKAGATKTLLENWGAIEEFATGKTIAELEAVLEESTPGEVVDAVSSSTLVDTHGYISSIVEAAKIAK